MLILEVDMPRSVDDRRRANSVAARLVNQAADPDGLRAPCGEVHVGADYTAAEFAFLKAVDTLRKTVRFPTATDYFRLARQVLLPEQGV